MPLGGLNAGSTWNEAEVRVLLAAVDVEHEADPVDDGGERAEVSP